MTGPHAPSRPERITATERILELLRVRARTSVELAEVGGLNYRARVSDARRAGAIILCTRHPEKPVNWYSLVRERRP